MKRCSTSLIIAANSLQSCPTDYVRPHRWKPMRLTCPWDSPGKNTGVGCHFLLQCMKVSESEVAQSCPTLCEFMDCSPPCSSIHGIFPGKSIGLGCHFLLQGIFPTQGSNLGLPHCKQTLYCLSHQGSNSDRLINAFKSKLVKIDIYVNLESSQDSKVM